ncbi:acyl-CoA reductase-like NAD-dependent aldehyde dehydrogenase [Actinocorallia herbida]|uniref:Acyl-CoA reductase-like NAD-dependent aldehyde dehydrogenase n=1 Tax=Actinocorallia herbida TaxID=58109 RepID=A0A3N1D612_9ACTN|nr:aldehyde dehydrogenase family protein [Actinocorallia herbida]ROO88528.1 acyl-CoA reductase-like NAD-dependent aldehyde dehydrogenase [Actinocorallia herbida]
MSGSIAVENPGRIGEVVGEVPVATAAQVDTAVRAAGAAQRAFGGLPVAERIAVLERVAGSLEDDEALAELLARESGKPLGDCRGEIRFAGVYLRWAASRAAGVLADAHTDDASGRLLLRRRPFGVVGAITPWNAPIILTLLKVGPALAAGNTIVVKPSPLAPLAIARILARFPDGLVHVVHGEAEAGAALVSHPLVRKVAFTGGEAAGRAIGALAGKAITPAVLELGGNDPAVFLADADLSDAAMDRLVMGSFQSAGQVCMAAKRLYVPEARFAEFRDAYVAAAARVVVLGDALAPDTTVGPVISAGAAERLRALAALGEPVPLGRVAVDLARGHYVRPTLLTGLDDASPVVADEQFGPVVPVLTYREEEDVLARANAGELGLGASVWSADEDRAFAFARRFEAGFTFVNTHGRTGMALRAPFGGVKRSGFGREYGEEGITEYTQTCAVHLPAAFRAGGAGMGAAAYPA